MGAGKHEKLKSFCACNCWEKKKKRVSRHSQALHGSRTGIHTRAENGISWLGLTQRANRGWTGAAAACGSLTLTGQLQGRVLSRYGDGFGGRRRPVIRSEEGYKLPGRDRESPQGTGNSHSALSRGFPRLPLPFVVGGNWQPSVTRGTSDIGFCFPTCETQVFPTLYCIWTALQEKASFWGKLRQKETIQSFIQENRLKACTIYPLEDHPELPFSLNTCPVTSWLHNSQFAVVQLSIPASFHYTFLIWVKKKPFIPATLSPPRRVLLQLSDNLSIF